MKIDYLQISNILSFPFVEDISSAPKILFENGLNIIIGENGSGKSTALEIINFLFRRVIYKHYNVNQELFARRNSVTGDERRNIIQPSNLQRTTGFRLDPNWDTEADQQQIRIAIRLDDIDRQNIQNLRDHFVIIQRAIGLYSNQGIHDDGHESEIYIIDVILNARNNTFSTEIQGGQTDFGFQYLSEYHFFKEAISLNNFVNPDEKIPTLYESFTLISSFRNYHAFQPSISLRDAHPAQQIQEIRSNDYTRSMNTSDRSEPAIFALVRLQVAEHHFNLISRDKSTEQCEDEANALPFIIAINAKLRVVSLECRIRLIDLRTWQYNFEFRDTRRNKIITDINSLSAGQKAIVHLVFEAYGRGDLKGGVVIIDEPEIHLHYQFQHEYLQVINDLNRDQNCQYILVTHSEALINSNTINSVRRFSLNPSGHTEIFSPRLGTDQKSLIKILDNTRSTYAFFAKRVVLVEGDTDRYFFKSIMQEQFQPLDQEIAILHIGGKGEFLKWTDLFTAFGLRVYRIADFDYLVNLHYPSERGASLKTPGAIAAFKARNPDWESKLLLEYTNHTYILKEGDLELYLNIRKNLDEVISFCRNSLATFLADSTSAKSSEIRSIMATICA